jgi:hypothetical protein
MSTERAPDDVFREAAMAKRALQLAYPFLRDHDSSIVFLVSRQRLSTIKTAAHLSQHYNPCAQTLLGNEVVIVCDDCPILAVIK